MKPTTLAVTLAVLAAGAAGCDADALRTWQQMDLPTHNRQLAFETAKDVIGKHFEIATASWVQGAIETKPQLFEGKKSGTLADYRGAGGRWRRVVSFELADNGFTMVGMADVRLQREATDQAVAAARTGGSEEGASGRPRSEPFGTAATRRSGEAVWVDAGRDDALAKELLGEIAEQAGQAAKRDAIPALSTPDKEFDDARNLRDKSGP
jgi:hypothetical protein